MIMIMKAEKLRNTESAPSFTIVASLSTWVSSMISSQENGLETWFDAKGICYFDDERDMCYVFEQAGKQKTVKQAGQWLATMPKSELAQVLLNNPQLQKEWDQELGDRMIKIVFIGQHIKEQKDAIIAELDKCLA